MLRLADLVVVLSLWVISGCLAIYILLVAFRLVFSIPYHDPIWSVFTR